MDTWSDIEVDAALQHLSDLVTQTQATHDLIHVFIVFFVLVLGIQLGYAISHYFLPTKTDIGGQ